MKKALISLLLSVFIVSGLFFLLLPKKSTLPTSLPVTGPSEGSRALPKSSFRSLNKTAHLISMAFREETSLPEMVSWLKNKGFQPEVSEKENSDGEETYFLQVENLYPGSSDLHAHYEKEEDGRSALQYISFHYKLGTREFNAALQVIQRSFSPLGKPVYSNRAFRSWSLPRGYMLWVKQMNAQSYHAGELSNTALEGDTQKRSETLIVTVEKELRPSRKVL